VKEQIQGTARRLWQQFQAFSPGQKAVSIVAALALVIGGAVFALHTSKPSYSPLFTNLAPSDASAMVDKLNSAKIPYQLTDGGTAILVPEKDVYTERLAMSSAGLPASSQSGYSLLDKEGVTTSEFKEHVDYQRALEGELSNTIGSIQGVQAAQVHLAIPQQDVFNDDTVKTTASVLVTTSPSQELTTDQVKSIVNLVAASVPGLTTDQVTVSDSAGHVLSSPSTGITAGGSDGTDQAAQQYDNNLSTKIQAMLDKVVGPGHSVTTVNATLNQDSTTQHSINYSAPSSVPPLAEQSSNETFVGNGAGTGGVLGANGTTPPAASASGSGGSYVNNSGTKNNAVNQTETTTTIGPGALEKLGVSVVLDKSASNAISAASVQQLVSSVVTMDAKRGDSLNVQVLPFDTSSAQQAAAASAAAAKAAAAAAAHKRLISELKTAGIVVAVIVIGLIAWLAARRRRKNDDDFDEPEEGGDDLDRFLSALHDGPPPVDIPREPALRQPSMDEVQAAANREAITELANDQPEDVARLLRSWMNSKGS
jgi:flagellar M-ring protein FliF